jgi:hypothetical protein
MDMSTPQEPELHLDLPVQQELLLDVSTLHGPELHLDGAAQEEPVLLMDLSAKQRPAPGRVRTTGACMCWSGHVFTIWP